MANKQTPTHDEIHEEEQWQWFELRLQREAEERRAESREDAAYWRHQEEEDEALDELCEMEQQALIAKWKQKG